MGEFASVKSLCLFKEVSFGEENPSCSSIDFGKEGEGVGSLPEEFDPGLDIVVKTAIAWRRQSKNEIFCQYNPVKTLRKVV